MTDFAPGATVEVRTHHPRTGAVGWFPGQVVRLMPSGKLECALRIEGRPLVAWVDPVKVRAA